MSINLSIQRTPTAPRITARVSDLCSNFGVDPTPGEVCIVDGLRLNLTPGTITLLGGPSGSGKSAVLAAIEKQFPRSHAVHRCTLPPDRPIVECINAGGELADALSLLTACGLGEPKLWLRRFNELSEGERFHKLAWSVGNVISDPCSVSGVNRGPCSVNRRKDSNPNPKHEPLNTDHGSQITTDHGSQITNPILCDEFCTNLHRRLAKAIAYNLRKLTTRLGLTVVVATCHEDVVRDLSPDTVVDLDVDRDLSEVNRGPCPVNRRKSSNSKSKHGPRTTVHRPRTTTFSLRSSLIIEPGTKTDYAFFKDLHYRGSDELTFVDKVFVLKKRSRVRRSSKWAADPRCEESTMTSLPPADRRVPTVEGGTDHGSQTTNYGSRSTDHGSLLAIVVYCYAPLELRLRNHVTAGRFRGNAALLNKEVRILRRLVLHPDVRGCGLGHWLVKKTLPLVGVPYVECLANMGAVNPVFEKAGMERIGRCDIPGKRLRVVEQLKSIGADPLAPDFVQHVLRRPSVRKIVVKNVREWYCAICSESENRIARQSLEFIANTFRSLVASRPVYYLWSRQSAVGRRQ